jgi:hypothetical protein
VARVSFKDVVALLGLTPAVDVWIALPPPDELVVAEDFFT